MQPARVSSAIVTLVSLTSWAAGAAQAQTAVKLFEANLVTASAPCAGPAGCDPVRDRLLYDYAQLVVSCKPNPTGFLSSTPDGLGRLVVDNFIEVNGRNACTGGFSANGVESCFDDPVFPYIGAPALEAYQSVLPLDISRLLPQRGRATMSFGLVDIGVIYANSDVWLVTSCTVHPRVEICHKPDTRAEKLITVSQSAVAGHIGHGDTLNLSACRRLRGPNR